MKHSRLQAFAVLGALAVTSVFAAPVPTPTPQPVVEVLSLIGPIASLLGTLFAAGSNIAKGVGDAKLGGGDGNHARVAEVVLDSLGDMGMAVGKSFGGGGGSASGASAGIKAIKKTSGGSSSNDLGLDSLTSDLGLN